MTEDRAVRLLLASPCGAKANEQMDSDAYAQRHWQRALDDVDRSTAMAGLPEIRVESARLETVAAESRWKAGLGSQPATLTACLQGVLRHFQKVGSWELSLSVRDAGKLVGGHTMARPNAIKVLVGQGVLSVVGEREFVGDANTCRLNRSHDVFHTGAPVKRLADPAPNACRHRGVGDAARFIWQLLDTDERQHPAALAERAGVQKRTV